MKKYVPDYYKKFRCIADKCRHSCCIGWEIDIDAETMRKYKAVKGDFGKRLCANIKTENDVSSFILGENERCPFLNRNGLCDIFTEMGEDSLSQICTDHPRFRNYFTDREELGLGLCCEEVCRIILSEKDTTKLELIEDDGEEQGLYEDEISIIVFRDKLFEIAQDRKFSIGERCEKILSSFDMEFSEEIIYKCINEFAHMEVMDFKWREITEKLDVSDILSDFSADLETSFEQLLVYFLYRHIADSEDIFDLAARSAFCILSVKIINGIYRMLNISQCENFELLCEICRMYSSEIEYCEENTARLIEIFSNQIE